MTHGSLFSGIGGFDLAAEWMGWENKFHCEWNPFGQKVLHHYWPEAEQFTDITKSNFKKYANQIDILTGGFPCQPYSQAGKRKGKEDERHLWPEMLRAIREIQPSWVVGENVFGLINWSEGLVFHEVQTDLEAEGYEVWPYVLPAAAVNAPHRRDRVWFVAYNHNFGCKRFSEQTSDRTNSQEQIRDNKFCKEQRWNEVRSINERDSEDSRTSSDSNSNGLNKCNSNNEIKSGEGRINAQCNPEQSNDNGNASNSNNSRFKTFNNKESELGQKNKTKTFSRNCIKSIHSRSKWETFPSVSPICNGDDGISNRLDSITFPKWRNESIKAGGNAIVPQVVYQIFKSIEQYEEAIMQSL
jgi:DNA (cytosine-5)-methyltransferase 1